MAEAIAKNDWGSAAGHLGNLASESDSVFLAEHLPRLHEEFKLPQCFRDAIVPARPLVNYLANYERLGPDQTALINAFFKCAREAGANEQS